MPVPQSTGGPDWAQAPCCVVIKTELNRWGCSQHLSLSGSFWVLLGLDGSVDGTAVGQFSAWVQALLLEAPLIPDCPGLGNSYKDPMAPRKAHLSLV